jgi:uncharacterized protein YbaA (DUF1428 family)
MAYVDGFVLLVPKKNRKAYLKMAKLGRKVWLKHGALDYKECVGDDLKIKMKGPRSFPNMAGQRAGEEVWFSFIVYKSRAHRDAVNKKVMKDPSMAAFSGPMPFAMNRMSFGGFKVLVDA